MHYNDGLHDGQRISHMQGIATSLTPLAGLPPPIRSEPEHRTAEVTSGQEPEPSLDGQTRNQPGSLEEGRMKPRSPDDGSETEKDHAEDFIRVSEVGLSDDRSGAGAFDVNDVLGMVPSSQGGLPCDLTHPQAALTFLPNELVFHILSFLDVCDLLSTSRVNRLLRRLSLAPLLHRYRLQRNRILLPPLLGSPCRPSLAELIARSIFLTKTSVVSRRLGRSLVSIRLSRRLAARPSVEALVDRAVLPKECVPGMAPVHVAPALVAKRKAIEKERTKDTLRRWVGAKWKGEVRVREEDVRRMEESRGVGRVWRLRRFWERVSRGDIVV